jgi:hypothetical protein
MWILTNYVRSASQEKEVTYTWADRGAGARKLEAHLYLASHLVVRVIDVVPEEGKQE